MYKLILSALIKKKKSAIYQIVIVSTKRAIFVQLLRNHTWESGIWGSGDSLGLGNTNGKVHRATYFVNVESDLSMHKNDWFVHLKKLIIIALHSMLGVIHPTLLIWLWENILGQKIFHKLRRVRPTHWATEIETPNLIHKAMSPRREFPHPSLGYHHIQSPNSNDF